MDRGLGAGAPERLREAEEGGREGVMSLTGREFLYTPVALGLSTEAIRKIDELVDGVGLRRDGRRVRWRNLETLYQDLENEPRARQMFGPVVQREVRQRLASLQ